MRSPVTGGAAWCCRRCSAGCPALGPGSPAGCCWCRWCRRGARRSCRRSCRACEPGPLAAGAVGRADTVTDRVGRIHDADAREVARVEVGDAGPVCLVRFDGAGVAPASRVREQVGAACREEDIGLDHRAVGGVARCARGASLKPPARDLDGAAERLRSSMNSSLPPAGPRVRNSEMTTSFGGADWAAAGAAEARRARSASGTRRVRVSMGAG